MVQCWPKMNVDVIYIYTYLHPFLSGRQVARAWHVSGPALNEVTPRALASARGHRPRPTAGPSGQERERKCTRHVDFRSVSAESGASQEANKESSAIPARSELGRCGLRSHAANQTLGALPHGSENVCLGFRYFAEATWDWWRCHDTLNLPDFMSHVVTERQDFRRTSAQPDISILKRGSVLLKPLPAARERRSGNNRGFGRALYSDSSCDVGSGEGVLCRCHGHRN